MKKNLLLLASTSFLCLGTAAGAQEQDGNFYGAIRAGINWAHDEALEGNFASKDERDLGLVLGGAIGYDFKPMRLELEFMQRRNDLDGLTVRSDGGAGAALGLGPLSGPTALVDTNVNASTIMANFIYDVPVVKGFQPYLGAGIGVAIVDLDYRLAGGQDLLRSNDAEPAFQALAGFSSQLSDHWTAEVGYRFLTTAQSRLLVLMPLMRRQNISLIPFWWGCVMLSVVRRKRKQLRLLWPHRLRRLIVRRVLKMIGRGWKPGIV
ncbi:hypothetical protein JCM17843_25520 [Kordiimonadales bacterium JCM 17843]|nr:hypothetical protein JCM17843_25520 [Kordiimonadales bacterium JCM 17843]